jgi:hypothetical protein
MKRKKIKTGVEVNELEDTKTIEKISATKNGILDQINKTKIPCNIDQEKKKAREGWGWKNINYQVIRHEKSEKSKGL